jgi:hypothetical protein
MRMMVYYSQIILIIVKIVPANVFKKKKLICKIAHNYR